MNQWAWVLVVSSLVANVAPASPLGRTGIEVSGSGSHFFKVCSTCPNDGSFDSDTQGGDFATAAETTGFAEGFYSWLASGVLVGPNSLPVLKASAEAISPATVIPNFIGIGTTSGTASAQGLEEYHYAGTTPGTYTITFTVRGDVFGDDESIGAGVSVFGKDYDPSLEGEFQHTRIAGNIFNTSVSTGSFDDSRTVTFEVPANEDFFVLAFLSANALFTDCCSEAGVADASHTFEASFTAGDTSLLTVVPEPATLALLVIGLGAPLSLRRRRSSH